MIAHLAYKSIELSTEIIDCHYKFFITTCNNVVNYDEAVDGPRRGYWYVSNTHCLGYLTYPKCRSHEQYHRSRSYILSFNLPTN